jgi:O-methyltransferase involved in polyketide biosynthesis
MNTVELVAQKMQYLPEEQQDQVLDFVEFLTSKYQQKQDNRSAEQRAIDRLADVEDQDNPEKWITVVEIDEEINEKDLEEWLEKRGYKKTLSNQTA